MSELADRIIGHYERHAAAWDEDRARGTWNDKPWHGHLACSDGDQDVRRLSHPSHRVR